MNDTKYVTKKLLLLLLLLLSLFLVILNKEITFCLLNSIQKIKKRMWSGNTWRTWLGDMNFTVKYWGCSNDNTFSFSASAAKSCDISPDNYFRRQTKRTREIVPRIWNLMDSNIQIQKSISFYIQSQSLHGNYTSPSNKYVMYYSLKHSFLLINSWWNIEIFQDVIFPVLTFINNE